MVSPETNELSVWGEDCIDDKVLVLLYEVTCRSIKDWTYNLVINGYFKMGNKISRDNAPDSQRFVLNFILMIQSGHKFPQAMPWHVQKCDMIWSKSSTYIYKIWIMSSCQSMAVSVPIIGTTELPWVIKKQLALEVCHDYFRYCLPYIMTKSGPIKTHKMVCIARAILTKMFLMMVKHHSSSAAPTTSSFST